MTTPRQRLLVAMQRRYLDFRLPGPVRAPLRALEVALYERPAASVPIDRPIFVVGCHRSGTTVLYEALARHPDVACFTNVSSLLPDTPILANRIMDLLGEVKEPVERFAGDGLTISHRTPSEGIRIFERYAAGAPGRGDYCLDEAHADPALERYLRATIRKHLRYFGATRFLNKNPDNSVRLRYLNKLFPDARFVHLIRDGRAVCASLLKFREAAAAFFGPGHRHATSGVKVPDWPRIKTYWDADPVTSVGLLWRDVMDVVDRDRRAIPGERFVEVVYEDLVADPTTHLRAVAERCALRWDDQIREIFAAEANRLSLGARNEQWKTRFSAADLERLMPIIGPTMERHGYAVAS
jgi:omega-hydroxy-beta-dihydromenaquinone-9 sulfotransferase